MKYLIRYLFALALTVACNCVQGQNFYSSYLPQPVSDTNVAGTLSFRIYNNNFIKNNEYFGPYTEGITYIGSIFQPEVSWALSNKFSLSLGWYFRFFYGQDGFEQSLPVIRARYVFKPGMQLIFGQLYGQLQHGFLEPIYNTDNYFMNNPEYGVQLLVDRNRFYADLYLDWEEFLLPGEAHQEEISGGFLTSYRMNDYNDNRGLCTYFQSIIHHFGGQVDNSDNPIQSRANMAVGLKYSFLPGLKTLNRLTLSSSYIQSLELSQTNTIPFESGFGLQNDVTFENEWVKFSTGWFHGEYFFAPMGNYLFQSISELNNWYIGEKRDLITSKLLVGHQLLKGVNFGFLFESYYDTRRKSNDFSYGLNVCVDATVFEKRLKSGKE